MTHLFADGGRIIKSIRCEYAERLGDDGLPEIVRAMMREQHKAMFIALRSGRHDPAVIEICGAFPEADVSESSASLSQAPSRPRASAPPPVRRPPQAPTPVTEPAMVPVTQPNAAPAGAFSVPETIPPPPRKPTMPGLRAVVASSPPAGPAAQDATDPSSGVRYVETRPAPALEDPPSGTISIFGGGGDAALDTAILEYLASDDGKRA
jgi:hypothetical protein